MIFRKILPLLTAVSITGGAVTVAVLAPSVIASEQTMAQQYQPSFPSKTVRGEERGRVDLISDRVLPAGTQFFLTDFNDYGVIDEVYFKLYDAYPSGKYIYFSDWSGISPTGATAHVRVTVAYPDGSAEIITTNLTVIPAQNKAYPVFYDDITVTGGTRYTIDPYTNASELPAGTVITTLNTPKLESLRASGWTVDVVSNTSLLIEAPEDAVGSEEINLVITYPDGTKSSSSVMVTAIPAPKDNELYEVAYGDVTVTGGESVTVSPLENDLPTGTRIALADNTVLTSAGWALQVTDGGKLTATAPTDADGIVTVALTVTYPDGTTEVATSKVTAIPAPKDNEDEKPVTPNPPKSSGSSFGSS